MKLGRMLLFVALLGNTASAQMRHGGPPPVQASPPPEAAQFDFLVGQWEIVARPHVDGLAARIHGSPKFPGVWKAWRGFDGWGVEDEIRLTDTSGNPQALTHCVRVYDAAARKWNLSSCDIYRSAFHAATAEWRDGEMHLTSKGTDREGRAYISRTRFYDIAKDGFRYQQDRSYDDGRTWTEKHLEIEARRVAASAPR